MRTALAFFVVTAMRLLNAAESVVFWVQLVWIVCRRLAVIVYYKVLTVVLLLLVAVGVFLLGSLAKWLEDVLAIVEWCSGANSRRGSRRS